MTTTLDLLWERFKPRLTLGLPEVAEVLHGHDDHATREAVRAGITDGDILPGLVKTRGQWRVPLTALALWIDARVAPLEVSPERRPSQRVPKREPQAASTQPETPRRRGRLPDSVRLPRQALRLAAQRERAGVFFQQVRAFMDEQAWGPTGPSRRPRDTGRA